MDAEKLINAVFERRSLWDQKSKAFHNRDKSRKLWDEVGKELNVNSEIAKAKWKGLRDTFRRELQKITTKRSGDGADEEKKSSWCYYNTLHFLTDQMIPRNASGNIPLVKSSQTEDTENEINYQNSEFQEEIVSHEPTLQNTQSIPEKTDTEKISELPVKTVEKKIVLNKRKREAIQEKLLQIEEDKLNFFKQKKTDEVAKNEDYDYHFLMSLLPHFKSIPKERKLFAQMKLQQVILDEINTPYENLNLVNSQCTEYSTCVSPVSTVSNRSDNNFTGSNQSQEINKEHCSIATYVSNFQI